MAAEPINIFARKIDPRGVLELLRTLAPNSKITDVNDSWTIEISVKRGLFRKPAKLTFGYSREYNAEANFTKQVRGMQGYFSRFPQNLSTQRIMLLISTLRFALSVQKAEPDLFLDSDDDRLQFIFAVVRHLDGVIFTPSGLRDAGGKILYHAQLDPDSTAIMPEIQIDAPPRSAFPQFKGGTAPNPKLQRPARVAARALCLAAVAMRGMLERENASPDELERVRLRDLNWVEEVGIGQELEPDEWRLLQTPIGRGNHEEFVDAEWQIEGAAVLAWALGRFELPPYDIQADVEILGKALGLSGSELGRTFLSDPALRPAEEIETRCTQILGIHWRLRQQMHHPKKFDFERGSQDAWFGKLPLDGIRFMEGDLAVGNYPITMVPSEVLLPCHLTVQARHKAINWICGEDPIYSKVDTAT